MNYIFKIVAFVFVLSFFSCKENQPVKEIPSQQIYTLKVGVFDGNGAGAVSVIETVEALKIDKEIDAFPISAADIMNGKLDEIDALIFPGGSGSKQLNFLGKKGEALVNDFLTKQGKGVIGICAGAYMLCSTEGYPSLKIASVKHLDRAHYNRGRGLVEFKLNEAGLQIFPELKDKNQFLQYYDGPVIKSLETSKTYTKLGEYVTDIHPNKGAPEGVTPGKVFIYNESIGKAKIFAVAGHPESTPGMRWMIPRMARWVTNNKLVSYNTKWIDPNKNDKPILFTTDLKKEEKTLWWQLFEEEPNVRIQAIDKLHAMRSRPAVRWTIGLLRDTDPKVRAHAASLLAQTEYTFALKDVKASLKVEENETTKKAMQEAVSFLEK